MNWLLWVAQFFAWPGTVLLWSSLIFRIRGAPCEIADFIFVSGIVLSCLSDIFNGASDLIDHHGALAPADFGLCFFMMILGWLAMRNHDHWKDGWRKILKSGGGKAAVIRQKLVKKIRDLERSRKRIRVLKPLPIPA